MVDLTYNDIKLRNVRLSDCPQYRNAYLYTLSHRRSSVILASKNGLKLGDVLVSRISNSNVYMLKVNVPDDTAAEVINAVSYWLFTDKEASSVAVRVTGSNKDDIVEGIENCEILSRLKNMYYVNIMPTMQIVRGG